MPRRTFITSSLVLLLALSLSATFTGAQEADNGQSLFNGKDTTGWKVKNASAKKTWEVVPGAQLNPDDPKRLIASKDGTGVLLNGGDGKGSDIYTEKEFGDCELHVEFMVPKSGNSGIYLMGRYEVQVLDSHGKPNDKLGQGDVGAIYSAAAPSTNAAKPAGEWQTFHIVFQAPRFDADGKKTSHAKFLSIKLNGTELPASHLLGPLEIEESLDTIAVLFSFTLTGRPYSIPKDNPFLSTPGAGSKVSPGSSVDVFIL